MADHTEVSVTLSPGLHRKLQREAESLGVSMEWMVASLVCDTVDASEIPDAATRPTRRCVAPTPHFLGSPRLRRGLRSQAVR